MVEVIFKDVTNNNLILFDLDLTGSQIKSSPSSLGFMKRRSIKSRFTPTIGTFEADKPDTELAGTVAVVASEGLVRALWHSSAVPSPAAFVFESESAIIFKRGDNMVVGETSDVTVLS